MFLQNISIAEKMEFMATLMLLSFGVFVVNSALICPIDHFQTSNSSLHGTEEYCKPCPEGTENKHPENRQKCTGIEVHTASTPIPDAPTTPEIKTNNQEGDQESTTAPVNSTIPINSSMPAEQFNNSVISNSTSMSTPSPDLPEGTNLIFILYVLVGVIILALVIKAIMYIRNKFSKAKNNKTQGQTYKKGTAESVV